jgi:hypothetical protein
VAGGGCDVWSVLHTFRPSRSGLLEEPLMIYDINTGAELPRVGTGPHWERYTRAVRDRPELVDALATAIAIAIDDELLHAPVVNSSWLGSRVLEKFAQRAAWSNYVGAAGASSTLFGMIMWTVVADDPRAWLQQLTTNATPQGTDRVYWLR